jgi:hypothetical protein
MNKNFLAENYRRLFKGRLSSNDKNLISEASSIDNDPVLKKYGFDRLDAPETIKGKLATSARLKGITTVAYFDNSKWNLPTEPFARNKALDKIHDTIEKTLSKYLGGKVKNVWNSSNANVPDNFTAYSMTSGNIANITVDNGNVNGMDREVTGTYNGKPFELITDDGMTSIYINSKMVRDGSAIYDEILNAVNNNGYELEN